MKARRSKEDERDYTLDFEDVFLVTFITSAIVLSVVLSL